MDPIDDRRLSRIGIKMGDFFLGQGPLDGHARGSWARVISAESLRPEVTSSHDIVAVKILRSDDAVQEEGFSRFNNEARILDGFGSKISAVKLLGCGYIDIATQAPVLNTQLCFREVEERGATRVYPDVEGFTMQTLARKEANKRGAGWRPFLVLESTPFEHSLLFLLQNVFSPKIGSDHRNVMVPLELAMEITIQGLHLLNTCNQEYGLYFLDHKLEHVVWHRGFKFLDWNLALWSETHTGSLPADLPLFDLRSFVACVAYPLFASIQMNRSIIGPQLRGTSLPDPKTIPAGASLPFHGAEIWLDPALIEILSRPFWVPPQYRSAGEMATDLEHYRQSWKQQPWLDRLRSILAKVKAAQDELTSAKAQIDFWRDRIDSEDTALAIFLEFDRASTRLQSFIDHQAINFGSDD